MNTEATDSRPRLLVVCYSRTGNTRAVGRAIAAALGADFEELRLVEQGTRPRSYSRCSFDILLGRTPQFEPLQHDPAAYDLVIVGTPVWVGSVSSPVRAMLRSIAPQLPRIAMFLTHGGSSRDRVFAQLEDLAGRVPVARLAVRERDVVAGGYAVAVQRFADEVQGYLSSVARGREGHANRAEAESRRTAVAELHPG